jgi:transposase
MKFGGSMPNRAELSDEEWRTFYGLLLLNPGVHIGSEENCKRFLNAVFWVLRSGTQWRLLPASLSKWNSVFKRFSRWCERGVWQSPYKRCSQHPDLQQMLIDSTIARAHACCAAGTAGSRAEAEAEALE